MTKYNLSSSQADRINFDDATAREAEAMLVVLDEAEALQVDPQEYASVAWENFQTTLGVGAVEVDDIDEAEARYYSSFVAAVRQWQIDRVTDDLNDELWQKDTGYITAIEVAPATELANAAVVEIVVLDHDGDTIAYRYSDDSIDQPWELGEAIDAAEEWSNARKIQFERAEAE